MRVTSDDAAMTGCLFLAILSLMAGRMLKRPTSRLSRFVDRH